MSASTLKPEQLQTAEFIYSTAISRGVPASRARELAEASYRESGLNPKAQGPPVQHSGYNGRRAAGLFQLLSSGYVDRANKAGGVFDPAANLGAILPDYVNYWKRNPNAAPGAAAAAVERSGQPASWYDIPDSVIPLAGGAGARTQPAATIRAGAGTQAFAGGSDPRRDFLMQLASTVGQTPDPMQTATAFGQLRSALRSRMASPTPTPQTGMPVTGERGGPSVARGGIDDAFYTPLGRSVDEGRLVPGFTIPNHSGHGHVSTTTAAMMMRLISEARRRGLRLSENPLVDRVDPVHTENSDHYATFADDPRSALNEATVGRALDVGPGKAGPAELRAFMAYVMMNAA